MTDETREQSIAAVMVYAAHRAVPETQAAITHALDRERARTLAEQPCYYNWVNGQPVCIGGKAKTCPPCTARKDIADA